MVLYASETGNCESISEDLVEDIKSHQENDRFFPVVRYQFNSIAETSTGGKPSGYDLCDKTKIILCVIICSSTGNGDMPENGEKFFRMLRRKTNLLADGAKSNLLSHVFYTMLGLGSTDYTKYQHIPRFVEQKLDLLGANKFYYRGEADDATSLELVVEPWLEGLQEQMRTIYNTIRGFDAARIAEMQRPCEDIVSEVKDDAGAEKS